MPAPLTPIEKFIREENPDRRTRYEMERREQGLVRVSVWVPSSLAPLLKRFAARLVSRHRNPDRRTG
jgi:hypothetical protein